MKPKRSTARRVFIGVCVYLIRAAMLWALVPQIFPGWGISFLQALAAVLAVDFFLPSRVTQTQWGREDDRGHE